MMALARARRAFRDDPFLGRMLIAYAVIQFVLSWWDLPNSWSWEEDAVAPRELFMGLVNNLKPGAYHRYPLLHYVLYGLLSLPVSLFAVATADAWTTKALLDRFIAYDVMTGIASFAKLLTVVMGAVALWTLARIARRTVSVRAGRWAVLFAVTNLSVGYYFRTQNLDGPYLMWTALALDRLLTVAEHGRRRDYFLFAIFTAASIATKDQAYATYVLVGPLYLIVWPFLRPSDWAAGRRHWQRLLAAIGVGALALGLLSGALLNPTGFARRLEFLTGPASRDFRVYTPDATGLLSNAHDVFFAQAEFWWPVPVVIAAWVGVLVALRLPSDSMMHARAWRLLPLTAALSSLCFFTLVVGRCEHRFLLPFGFWLSYYLGVLADAATAATSSAPRVRAVTVAVVVCIVFILAHRPAALVLTQWYDGRHAVEAFLRTLPEGASVETYGRLPHQPRFARSGPYQTIHVHPTKPPHQRPPMPGVELIQAPLDEVLLRQPYTLVLNPGTAGRYRPLAEPRPGRRISRHQQRFRADPSQVATMRAALAGDLPGYRTALVAGPNLPSWATALGLAPVRIHGCTGGTFRVLISKTSELGP